MKILAFSDVHCDLEACRALVAAGADSDLVIGAGDFAHRHGGLAETMAVLEPLAEKAIYVPGNNETTNALRSATSAKVLHGQSTEFGGKHIFGIGAAIPSLGFAPFQSFDLNEEDAEAMLADIEPPDILVSHSPPKGIADQFGDHGAIGSTALLAAIERLQPALVLFGHVHDCWGQRATIDTSHLANLGPSVNWFEI